jgi:type 1 fimbriae regulatory protein FimB
MSIQSLSREEILQLLSEARRQSTRDYLMMLIAFHHGLRCSEVIALTPAHLADGYLTVQRLKGSNKTVQPLVQHENPLLNEAVLVPEFIGGMHSTQRLFPVCRQTFWRCIQRHAKAIGLPQQKRNTRVLKHSIAMQTIKIAGIENVRQFLGHKSGASTMEYLKVSDAEASARISDALKGPSVD